MAYGRGVPKLNHYKQYSLVFMNLLLVWHARGVGGGMFLKCGTLPERKRKEIESGENLGQAQQCPEFQEKKYTRYYNHPIPPILG